jgi:hypothetical protein
MKNLSFRFRVAAAVVFVLLAGALTTADQIVSMSVTDETQTVHIIKKDTSSCKKLQSYCSISCEDSTYTHGVCREGTHGATSAISVQCCCCTEGFEHRYFIGG